MRQTRRRFLTTAAAGAAAALLPGCGSQSTEPQTPAAYEPGKPLPSGQLGGHPALLS